MISRPSFLQRLGLAIWVPLLIAGLTGCGSDDDVKTDVTRYEDVRGRFMGTASDGRDVVIHHEAIPNVMRPMVMSLPLADPSQADAVDVDNPVAFDLVIAGSEIRVENLHALPDTTILNLPTPKDSTSDSAE